MKKALCITLLYATLIGQAKVSLPGYFSSNMVLQQCTEVQFTGNSSLANGQITIQPSWTTKTYNGTITNGQFNILIPTPEAGGPYSITFNDGEFMMINNVMLGDVWFCSGQSNMEMPIKGWGKVKNFEEELKNANYENIRLLQSKRIVAQIPLNEPLINNDGWKVCTATSVENFSALAYFYARYLWNKLHVPIGVIDCSWGGTPAEAWTSNATLQHVIGFEKHAQETAACNGDMNKLNAQYKRDMEAWQIAFDSVDTGMANGKPRWVNEEQTGKDWTIIQVPGEWEKLGLEGFNGIVWYQKVINIPESWVGKDIRIDLGKIDDDDITYFNGVKIGKTNGYDIHRSYFIPGTLVNGRKAILTVRVTDNSGIGGLCGENDEYTMTVNEERISIDGSWMRHVGCSLSDLPQSPRTPDNQNYISNLFNAMVYPFRNFPIKGVIWYQGEENANRWKNYYQLFPAMIADWRTLWKYEFPFYFVQLAGWQDPKLIQPESTWAHIREAQYKTLHTANTGMACIVDIGEAHDIHPKNKQEVGIRLAKCALAHTYRKGNYKLPELVDYRIEQDKVVLTFNQDLTFKGKQPLGFVVAGANMDFREAEAKVSKNIVTLSCPSISMPYAARYAWADNPICNMYGNDGLPLVPFRTDDYK